MREIRQQKLLADDGAANDRFGGSVSVSGDTAIVGAQQDDDNGPHSGSAYVFRKTGSTWWQLAKLLPDDGAAGDTVVVGAPWDDDKGDGFGSAYVFRETESGWTQIAKLLAGDTLLVSTATVADGSGEFVNGLDPAVDLYDPDGVLVGSDDNGAADGRNALLTHTAAATGTYRVRLRAAGGTAGEYVLSIAGHSGPPPTFEVFTEGLADGTGPLLPSRRLTVDFSDSVLLTSLEAADLTVDGLAATDVSIADGNTLVFELPAELGDGAHEVAIADGAILDLQGTPIEAFAGSFVLDTTPPRVVRWSVDDGNLIASRDPIFRVEFDEELRAAGLDSSAIFLRGQLSGPHEPSSVDYDPAGSTLTVRLADLPEDFYCSVKF